eukprot:scaffold4025_cov106-Cylindrotheca_fusiformis.AAC.5
MTVFLTSLCCLVRSSSAFLAARTSIPPTTPTTLRKMTRRLFSVSATDVNMGVSRIETLQKLLSRHGAPGSQGCTDPNDLAPVVLLTSSEEEEDTPELVSSLMGYDEYMNLHPHLYPLARSKTSGNLICALRRAFADDATEWYENSSSAPWPIVEATMGGRGMKLLALNSEHLMRRIVCECDFTGKGSELVELYNNGLGGKTSSINDKAMDTPYEPGSVEKLGYGVDKYVLLRVGPFPDIYESLALGHAKKGDESSSLISAEAANSKISGFASTFLFYARLLATFPNRDEESRDAARICLRMPLPSIGLSDDDFREVAILGQLADESDSDVEVFAKMQRMYEKIRESEQEDPTSSHGKTPEQMAFDEANYILDTVALTGGKWSDVRPQLAEIYKSVGRNDMAAFVNPKDS